MLSLKFNSIRLLTLAFGLFLSISPQTHAWWWSSQNKAIQISIDGPSQVHEIGQTVQIQGQIREVKKLTGQLKNLKNSDLSKFDIEYFYPDRTTEITDQVSQSGKLDFSFITPALEAGMNPTFSIVVGKSSPRARLLRRIQGKLEARVSRIQQKISELTAQGGREAIIAYLQNITQLYQRVIDKIQTKLSQELETLAEVHLPIQLEGRVTAPYYSMNLMSGFMNEITSTPSYGLTGENALVRAKVTNVSHRVPGFNWGWGGSQSRWYVDFRWQGESVQTIGPKRFERDESVEHEFESAALTPGNFPFSIRVKKKSIGGFRPLFAKLTQNFPVLADDVAPVWEVRSPQSEGSYQALPQVDATLTDLLGRINPDRLEVRLSGTLDNGGTLDQSVLTGLSVQLNPAGNGESATITGDLNPLEPGEYTLSFSGEDRAGLFDDASLTFRVDREAPLLQLSGLEPGVISNQAIQSLSVTVVDASEVQTQIQINGNEVFSSNDSSFVADLSFPNGINTVTLIATDTAGNSTTEEISPIVVDTIAPILTQVIPADGSIANTLGIAVSGSSSEPLQAVSINGVAAQISPDQLSFNGSTSGIAEGSFDIEIVAVDLAGNATQVNSTVEIVLRVLNGHLVSVVPDPDGEHLLIVGSPGASRAGVLIEADGGFFNSGSASAELDGSFQVQLNVFQTATVTATDATLGRSDSIEVSYNAGTTLSGSIRDPENRPLPGATVRVANTDIAATTDGSGTFMISEPFTGDQFLLIDASTANDPCADCPPRVFSPVRVPITIGLNQSNVLDPFFIAPFVSDGNEVTVNEASDTTVSHPNLPGAELRIPAGVATFPDGSKSGQIALGKTRGDRTLVPVPGVAVPDEVYCLEPSGVTFSEPVELTLPNENDLPPGTNLVVFSMDATKGHWEIDGIAVVTEDGQSIRTKPGMGITHQSLVYVSPTALKTAQRGAQDKPGADTFNGALTTSVQMPTYKSLGQDVGPSLIYRSSWAHPQVLMTNLISIDRQEYSLDRGVGGGSFIRTTSIDIAGKAFYQPKEVRAQFSTTGLLSEELVFEGIPNESVISFNFPLDHLDSGIAPYLAHYEYKLEHIQVGTQKTIKKRLFGATTVDVAPFYRATEIRKVFPQDLGGPLYVQNKANSSAGRGWKIAGPQQIVNPTNDRIMIEEPDGTVSSYAVDNKIDTVFGEPTGARLDLGVSLNGWPNIHYINRTTDIQYTDLIGNRLVPVNRLTRVDGSSQEDTREEVRIVDTHRAVIAGWHFTNLGTDSFLYDASVTEDPSQMIEIDPGRIIIASNRTSRLIMIDCTSGSCNIVPLAGRVSGVRTLSTSAADSIFVRRDIEDYCRGLGATCTLARYVQHFAPNSIGNLPIHNFADGFHGESYLNRPLGITTGLEPNTIIVADTGNHRIRKVNILTRETTTIAGNGQTIDSGDGGMAIDAGIYHPRGVTYDNAGNLYVSSENGLIRRIDTTGRISTFAGRIRGDEQAVFADQTSKDLVSLNLPTGMVFDSVDRALYVADSGHHRIVKIFLDTNEAVNVAGNGASGYSGDGGPALNAALSTPYSVELDQDRNLLIHDRGNRRIRRVIFNNSSDGTVLFLATAEDHSKLERSSDGTFVRTTRDGLMSEFNSTGQEISRSDRLGRTNTYAYNSDGNLISQTDPTGRSIQYNYSGGLLSSITDPANRTTTLSYNGNDLDEVTLPDGTSRSFTYDPNGLMIEETNQRGFSTQYSYNEFGRIKDYIRPDNTLITVNDSGSASAANNFTGGQVGELQKAGMNEGEIFDGMTDAKGANTKYVKNSQGQVSEVIDADGRTSRIEYNEEGRPSKVTRSDGETVEFEYDSQTGDVTRNVDTANNQSISRTYNDFGQVLTETNELTGVTTSFTYNSLTGLLSSTSNSVLGTVSTLEYNSLGRIISTQTLGRPPRTSTYDASGNLVSQRDELGNEVSYVRDHAGNITEVRAENGSNPQITRISYDDFNRRRSVTTAVGTPNEATTTYSYLETGELAEIRHPIDPNDTQSNEAVSIFEYDSLGRLTKSTNPLGFEVTNTYDDNGNLIRTVDPNGDIKEFEYNSLNQLTRKVLSDDTVDIAYASNGEIESIQNNVSRVEIQFNNQNNVTSSRTRGLGSLETVLPDITVQYQYDDRGNRSAMIDPTGSTSYQYDSLDRLTQIENQNGETFTFEFDSRSRINRITRPGGNTTFSFDESDFITSIAHSGSIGTISSFTYERDQVGNRTKVTTPTGDHDYSYDEKNQLKTASNPDVTTPESSETFDYDSFGNRTADQGGSYSFDALRQRLQEDYRYIYAYDNNGNLTSRQEKGLSGEVINYEYSSENQLIGFRVYPDAGSSTPSKEVSYFYDGLGRRIHKQVVNHSLPADPRENFSRSFVYDDHQIILEYDGDQNLLTQYTHSGLAADDVLSVHVTQNGVDEALAQISGSYTYLKDSIGTIRAIADTSGNKVQEYVYSAYGRILEIRDSAANSITNNPIIRTAYTFGGREYDFESGLYYLRARYYSAESGRFLQIDPDPGRLNVPISVINKYIYALNNPTNLTDPSGESVWTDIRDVLKGIFVGIGTALAVAFVVPAIAASAAAWSVAALGISGTGLLAGAVGAIVGAATGAIVGAAVGGLTRGVLTWMTGGSFIEGFREGLLQGAVLGGLIGLFQGFQLGYNSKASSQSVQSRLDELVNSDGRDIIDNSDRYAIRFGDEATIPDSNAALNGLSVPSGDAAVKAWACAWTGATVTGACAFINPGAALACRGIGIGANVACKSLVL